MQSRSFNVGASQTHLGLMYRYLLTGCGRTVAVQLVWFFTLILTLCSFVAQAAQEGEQPAQAQAKAKGYIVADDFRGSKMRGVNIASSPGPLALAKFSDLGRLGANVVRTWIFLERCPNCENYALTDEQLANMDKLAALAQSNGFYVVITLHVKRKVNSRDEFWDTDPLKASIVGIWRTLAERFKNNTAIAAFDLYNEPFPIGPANNPKPWLDFASEMITAIRQVDPHRTIIVEGAPHARPMGFPNMKPLPFPNLVYSAHFYEPFEVTHQGVDARFPQGVAYPQPDKWNSDYVKQQLQLVQDFVTKYDVPMYVGEFSCVRWAPGDSRYQWLRDVINVFEANGWSWSYHAFREWDGWSPEIGSNDRKVQSASWDAPVMKLLRDHFQKRTNLNAPATPAVN